ncbi:NADH-dependent flavin oxidoreductase [uncultured Veillonella sp.]|uniref:NADH-dependent flavin oxidoreductase n=1 Tax=uncultured Veillonella sp. TaxID=159268 RepID=UPI002609B106|nr:NADH-dependent flavin oxidoreductase [uncultured Veillonella sp.]
MKQLVTDSIQLRSGLSLKNRLAIAPMTTRMSYYDGTVTGDEINYYGSRTGDVGLFITGVAYIKPNGIGWTGELGIHDDSCIPGLSKLAARIKENGTRAILQMFHAGRMTDSKTTGGLPIVGPSAVPGIRPGQETPQALSNEEIEEIINDFKAATVRAIKAGFDGIEIHGANQFLLHQFFSPHANQRTDKWGGSIEKRYTFIETVVDEVLATVKESGVKEFAVGYRFSPREESTPGFNLKETLWLVDKLADKELDYLHVSMTHYDGKTNIPGYEEKTMLQYIHETINGRLPLISVGHIHTEEDVTEALEDSEMAAVASAILLDPKWAWKILNGKADTIRHTMNAVDRDSLQISNGAFEFLAWINPDKVTL